MNQETIVIATDFSLTPAGRHRADEDFSDQRFREDLLLPALVYNDLVIVDLDGTIGYGVSFLESAFGGLSKNAANKIRILSSRSLYSDQIQKILFR